MDLNAFYAREGEDGFLGEEENFVERIEYMHHAPPPDDIRGNPNDQFTNGGGQPSCRTVPGHRPRAAQCAGRRHRHRRRDRPARAPHGASPTLQRSSRAADGTPLHIRMDGPAFDSRDVPDGSNKPKLQFTVFVPTAEFFRVMRVTRRRWTWRRSSTSRRSRMGSSGS